MLASDGQAITELSHEVGRQWGHLARTIDVEAIASIETELRDSKGGHHSGQWWIQIACSLASGDFDQAMKLLIEQNSFVMKIRTGGAPWIAVTDGRLRVRFRDDQGG